MKVSDFTNINKGYSTNKLFLQVDNIRYKSHNNSDQRFTNIDDTNGNTNLINGLGEDWSVELFFNFKDIVNKLNILNQNKINQVFDSNKKYNDKQYLFTLNTQNGAVVVVKYLKNKAYSNENGIITISIQPILNDVSFNTTITLSDVNIFNSPKYFSLTQKKEDNKLTYSATISDIGRQIITKNEKTSSVSVSIANLESKISGNVYAFKNNQISLNLGDYKYEDSTLLLNPTIDNNSIFQGEVLKIRLWNKKLENTEIVSHYKDIENFGTLDFKPLKNIIADFKVKNVSYLEDSGVRSWSIEDVSNNRYYLSSILNNINTCKVSTKNVTDFDNTNVIKNISIISKHTSSNLDEFNTSNYVNILSYNQEENKTLSDNFREFPTNTMPFDFNYKNTNRVTIDMSIVKIINDDISKIISDINSFTLKLSGNQSKFEYSYKSLESLRREFFDKFSDESYINYASLGNVFKYFDNIMSSILYDIVPSRVRFEGFNFVYESHSLERHKYEHKNKDSINTISPSIILTSSNASPEHFVNFSRENIKCRRSASYTNQRYKST